MFHTNLKSRRLFCGLSQQQVADHLNVTPQSISKWEKGTALPSIEYLPKLATVLNCNINDFFEEKLDSNRTVSILNDFFALMIELIYNKTKNEDHFVCFIRENPTITDLFPSFCRDLNQHQTISCKILQNILSCSEPETIELLQHLETCKMIEKLQGSSLYFVTPDAGEFLSYILERYSQYVTDGELAQAWKNLKTVCPELF